MENKVAIVIPAFNEAEMIGEVLDKISAILDVSDITSVIVVDDGSTDGTSEIVKRYEFVELIIHKKNMGRGAALNTGLRTVLEPWVIFFDADLEYDPADLVKVINVKKENCVVYGSRYSNSENYESNIINRWRPLSNQKFGPFIANKIISILVLALYGIYYDEHFSGIRLYPSIPIKEQIWIKDGFEGDHEKASYFLRKKYDVLTVPVRYSPRDKKNGKKIRASDGVKAIWIFILMRFTKRINGDS